MVRLLIAFAVALVLTLGLASGSPARADDAPQGFDLVFVSGGSGLGNPGWAANPTVGVITVAAVDVGVLVGFAPGTIFSTLPPSSLPEEAGSSDAILDDGDDLVLDAISEYWNQGPDVDGELVAGEVDGPCVCFPFSAGPGSFGGFGAVDLVTPLDEDVVVAFADVSGFGPGVLGVAFVSLDEEETIVFVLILLTVSPGSLTDENYKNLAAHELGHGIDLPHEDAPGTLMNPFLSPAGAYLPLDEDSLGTIEEVYGLEEEEDD